MSFPAHPYNQVIQNGLLACQQIFFEATAEVETVDLEGFADQGKRLVRTSEMPQDDRFQMAAAQVMPVTEQGLVDLVQGILPIAFRSGQLGQRIISGILPGGVPASLIEEAVGFVRLALVFQSQSEVVQRFAVIGVRVLLRQRPDSPSQIKFGFGKLPLTDQPQPHCIVVADIAGITAQRLLIIIGGGIGRMAVLFEMQAGQVELFRRPDVLRVEGGFCRFGNFLYLIGFGFPG